jgi:hypothetical protein
MSMINYVILGTVLFNVIFIIKSYMVEISRNK